MDKFTSLESRAALENLLQELQIVEKELQKKKSQKSDISRYTLRSRKEKGPDKLCPVVV